MKLTLFSTALRLLAASAAVVGSVPTAASFMAFGELRTPGSLVSPDALFYLVANAAALACAGLTLLIVTRARRRSDATALALSLGFGCLAYSQAFPALLFPHSGFDPRPEALGEGLFMVLALADPWQQARVLAPAYLAAAAFLRFSVLFPTPLEGASIREDRAGRASPIGPSLPSSADPYWLTALVKPLGKGDYESYLAFFRSWRVWAAAAGFALVPWATPDTAVGDALVSLAFATAVAAALVLGVVHLGLRYRTLEPGDRHQILWSVAGFNALLWMAILSGALVLLWRLTGATLLGWPLGFWSGAALIPLGALALVALLGVGVLLQGAVGPELVIRQTTMNGALVTVLVFLFAGVEELVSDFVGERVGIPSDLGSFVAAGVAAVVFRPLQRILKKVADRLVARSPS